MKRWLQIIVAVLAAQSLQALAQAYPTKPVQMVIAFTAGSATDIVARALGAKLTEFWGQQVIAENRGGAGGSIGSAVVARAAPDGYTLLVNSNAHAINPATYAKLPYDTEKDFVDVAPISSAPNVFVVGNNSPYKTLAEFLAAAKARPDSINFAHAGIGSGTHLNTEKFIAATGIRVVQIPYKGTPEVLKDLIGGQSDCYFSPIGPTLSSLRGGRLRALAVSGSARSSQLPDVPTVAEAGVKGADFALWFGIWAPAGTPAPIVEKINADVNRALASPDLKAQLAKLGNDTMHMTTAEFRKFVRDEIADMHKVIKAAGIKPQ
jgi:tripartite-type tricarboxylate transporter receptor subunit TctC